MSPYHSHPGHPSGPGHRAGCGELSVSFLGSGSSGNCSLVRGEQGALLVDCGFSARETLRRAALAGITADHIVAMFVTHEHGDHVRGVRVLAKRLGIPVYATAGTRNAARLDEQAYDVRTIEPGLRVRVAGIDVLAFRTSHDAAEPVGFRFDGPDGAAIGLATDTGVLTHEILEALQGCDVIGIESNHDERMLADGPYPRFLKQRIQSHRGHLSNAAAAAALSQLRSERLRQVVALHVSRTNNTVTLADRALRGVCATHGISVHVVPHE